MKFFGLAGALALTLGLSGCMGAMNEHHDAMMGGMMGEHNANECPNAADAAHETGAEATAAHDQAAQAPCPPADEAQHQHPQPQN